MRPLASGTPAIEIDMVTDLDIGPGGVDRYLELVGDHAGPLIKYRRGRLTLVSPSHEHERGAERLDGVVKAICAELDIDYYASSSTLFRQPDLDSGIEADKTYYVAHEPDVRGVKGGIDLAIYPPPDLVVEVVITHNPAKSLAICRELGVPEVQLYWPRRKALEFLGRNAEGGYAPLTASRSFPVLTAADALPWLDALEGEPDNRWERRLREWVHVELAPRRRP